MTTLDVIFPMADGLGVMPIATYFYTMLNIGLSMLRSLEYAHLLYLPMQTTLVHY